MMNQKPVFAVVGHPNKGKSSVVATLSQNDAIAIALEPGTTRAGQAYPLTVDGQELYTLVDTPGFQRPEGYCNGWKPTACRPRTTRKPCAPSCCSIGATAALWMNANCWHRSPKGPALSTWWTVPYPTAPNTKRR